MDGSHLFNSCWTHAASFVSEPPLRDNPDTPSKLVEAVVNKSSNIMVCSHHKPLTLEQRSEMGGQANFSLIPKVQDKTELGKDMAAVTERRW